MSSKSEKSTNQDSLEMSTKEAMEVISSFEKYTDDINGLVSVEQDWDLMEERNWHKVSDRELYIEFAAEMGKGDALRAYSLVDPENFEKTAPRALYSAVRGNSGDSFRFLKEHVSDLDELRFGGVGILDFAHQEDAFNVLPEMGAEIQVDPNKSIFKWGSDIFSCSLSIKSAEKLVRTCRDINERDEDGNTFAHFLALNEDCDLFQDPQNEKMVIGNIDAALERGFDMEAKNNKGMTPCDVAEMEENFDFRSIVREVQTNRKRSKQAEIISRRAQDKIEESAPERRSPRKNSKDEIEL